MTSIPYWCPLQGLDNEEDEGKNETKTNRITPKKPKKHTKKLMYFIDLTTATTLQHSYASLAEYDVILIAQFPQIGLRWLLYTLISCEWINLVSPVEPFVSQQDPENFKT